MNIDTWIPHARDTWTAREGRLRRDVQGERYLGTWRQDSDGTIRGPLMERVYLPKGTRVKIVMVSRFGDIGITDRLDDEVGYIARIDPGDLDEL